MEYTFRVETCRRGSKNFKPVIGASFISGELAEEFVKRNKKKYEKVRKRISYYRNNDLIYSRYFWND
jgi:hypothetical protein